MSALSTPGGGGTTAQSKPTSGKSKYQKLDINSLYCANRGENSEPSLVKSQLSRKHGMQSLGKVPSARRPPANLPSLKTETGQDANANSISTTATSTAPPTCTPQTTVTTTASVATPSSGGGGAGGGWNALPPPSSSHFRNEFPSLEAAAQPSHRDHAASATHPQLRPHTEGSWTSGGSVRAGEAGGGSVVPTQTSQQTPAFRAILPPFLMKGSIGGGGGLGSLSTRETRSPPQRGGGGGRAPPAVSRATEVLTARPILREEQISSLDEISRDAGWAMQDDIDYDQKLDFSDGESSAPSANRTNKNRSSEQERSEKPEPNDEEQIWAERRQKQNNEVAAAVARARQRKEEEQRRQRESQQTAHHKDDRDSNRHENRERQDIRDRQDIRERQDIRDRPDNRERADNRDKHETRERAERERPEPRERLDNRDRTDRDRPDVRDSRDQNRERSDNRDQLANRDRADARDQERSDNRDRERDRMDNRDRERNDNRERERNDNRDKPSERDRERGDRMDRADRNDRDFRDYNRGPPGNNEGPAFSKTFQSNIPPRFLKQQQNRQHDDQNKAWAFPPGKGNAGSGRRQEPPAFNAPRHAQHNARRSYSRDYSDREDDYRREKEGGSHWRSEMQDYERSGREFERQSSKESHKEYSGRRSESDRKSVDSNQDLRSSAADKLSEVFDRKSAVVGAAVSTPDPVVTPTAEQKQSAPPQQPAKRESVEKEFVGSWADNTCDTDEVHLKQQDKNSNVPAEESSDVTTLKPKEVKVEAEEIKQPAPQQVHPSRQSTPPSQGYNTAPHFPQPQQNRSQSYSQQVQSHQQPQPQHQHSAQGQVAASQPPIKSQPIQQPYQLISQPTATAQPAHAAQFQLQNQSQPSFQQEHRQSPPNQASVNRPAFPNQKTEKPTEAEIPSKVVPEVVTPATNNEKRHSIDQSSTDAQKRLQNIQPEDKAFTDQSKLSGSRESIERKNSAGSVSDKKGRGYGNFAVYNRGWGSRDSRGRRSHRNSRSDNRASESDGSPDGAPNNERKDRRRGPRSPRGPKKTEGENAPRPIPNVVQPMEGLENREAFAPRGQPSRRGRGGFQSGTRPPAPAKRVTGYGPPNTKSPFSQASQVRPNDDNKDRLQSEDKSKNKPRQVSSGGRSDNRGRDNRRNRGPGIISGEDENWETTSEHSDGGNTIRKHRSQGGSKGSGGDRRGQQGGGGRSGSGRSVGNQRNAQGAKKEQSSSEITEGVADLKISASKKDDEVVDDGFQEVRNKKNSKEGRAPSKEEPKQQAKSQPNQSQRNGSSTRSASEKSSSATRGSAQPPSSKPAQPFERSRHPRDNLAPRFMKQRQNKQLGLSTAFGPDTGAAPPPPAVNAWDKPISQSLRGNVEEAIDTQDKSAHSSQRSTPCAAPIELKATPACAVEKTGMLDGTTPPVETIIFENTNYKSAPPAEPALKQKFQPPAAVIKPEEVPREIDARTLAFNGDVRLPPRSIQELIAENGRPATAEPALGIQMSFEATSKPEDSSDMKLDFSAFDSDLGHLTEEKTSKALGLQRTHMGVSTISPSAADLNLKIASVKKVWEMPAVAEGAAEELVQFAGGVNFEEVNVEGGAPPNVCKVKPTQQLQSPPPQHYNHVGYASGYGGLSVPSPPAVLYNSSQQLLGSSQQMPQQGGLYGAFLDQSRGQFGGFPGAPYGAGSGPYNYQPTPDMFQNLSNQYRMAPGAGAAFGQSGQLANSPSTVLISSSSNSLMSTTVKPSNQQIGPIGQYTNNSKGGGVGGVGSAYQAATQQYLGYSGPVGDVAGQYTLPGLLPRPAPPTNSYYSPYQPPPPAPAPPTYPLQFTQPAQSAGFSSQFLSSQLQAAAAAVQQMQQYRAPMQQQYGAPGPRQVPPSHHQPIKSPLHEHANGFVTSMAPGGSSPTPKQSVKPPSHSPPHHKYHQPPPQHPHSQHHQMQQQVQNNNRCGGGGPGLTRAPPPQSAPRYPAPIQRPHAPAYRTAPPSMAAHRYYAPPTHHHHQQPRGGVGGAPERAAELAEPAPARHEERAAPGEDASDLAAAACDPAPQDKAD